MSDLILPKREIIKPVPVCIAKPWERVVDKGDGDVLLEDMRETHGQLYKPKYDREDYPSIGIGFAWWMWCQSAMTNAEWGTKTTGRYFKNFKVSVTPPRFKPIGGIQDNVQFFSIGTLPLLQPVYKFNRTTGTFSCWCEYYSGTSIKSAGFNFPLGTILDGQINKIGATKSGAYSSVWFTSNKSTGLTAIFPQAPSIITIAVLEQNKPPPDFCRQMGYPSTWRVTQLTTDIGNWTKGFSPFYNTQACGNRYIITGTPPLQTVLLTATANVSG